MQYVELGRTGLKISRLGFGGIPIQRIDQPGTKALLKAAHEAGINYIDTARGYTVSEAWIVPGGTGPAGPIRAGHQMPRPDKSRDAAAAGAEP